MSLDCLPLEVLLLVTNYLTTPEYSAVRLTSKALNNATHESWASEFFTTRQFSLQLFSLDVLLAISNHDDFHKRVKRLIIGTDTVDAMPLRPSQASDDETKKQENNHQEFYATQLYANTTGLDVRKLAEAIRNLPNLTNIEVRNYWSSFKGGRVRDGVSWKSYGWSLFKNATSKDLSFGDQDFSSNEAVFSEIFRKVLAAAVECRNLRTLVAHIRPRRGMNGVYGLCGRSFWVPEIAQAQYRAALRPLETLMVNLIDTQGYWTMWGTPKDLVSFSSLVPNLNHLRINCQHHMRGTIPDLLEPMAHHLKDLTVLELGSLQVPIDELILLKSFKSLRGLSLFQVNLQTGSWKEALSMLAKAMTCLRTIHLKSLRERVNERHPPVSVNFKRTDDERHESDKIISCNRHEDLTAAVNAVLELIVTDDLVFRDQSESGSEVESESESDAVHSVAEESEDEEEENDDGLGH